MRLQNYFNSGLGKALNFKINICQKAVSLKPNLLNGVICQMRIILLCEHVLIKMGGFKTQFRGITLNHIMIKLKGFTFVH